MKFSEQFQAEIVSQIRAILVREFPADSIETPMGRFFGSEAAAREILRQCHEEIRKHFFTRMHERVAALPGDWFFDARALLEQINAELQVPEDSSQSL